MDGVGDEMFVHQYILCTHMCRLRTKDQNRPVLGMKVRNVRRASSMGLEFLQSPHLRSLPCA
jgi:hypothetical protein